MDSVQKFFRDASVPSTLRKWNFKLLESTAQNIFNGFLPRSVCSLLSELQGDEKTFDVTYLGCAYHDYLQQKDRTHFMLKMGASLILVRNFLGNDVSDNIQTVWEYIFSCAPFFNNFISTRPKFTSERIVLKKKKSASEKRRPLIFCQLETFRCCIVNWKNDSSWVVIDQASLWLRWKIVFVGCLKIFELFAVWICIVIFACKRFQFFD